ncbi:MAG: lipoprotein [Gammaproteobacteria bacterium]|nr:lipoprotein [Gammaproteobacteria bacterium]MCW8924427.1 lipoprotein [Gammaproteobacteria bacterium]
MPLILILLVSACGKTGPLYLPDAEKEASTINTPAEILALASREINRGSL